MAEKRQNKPSEYTLSKVEVRKLLNGAPTFQYRSIIKTFLQTGVRRFELAALDIRDIDFDRRRATIRGKGDKERTVIMSEDLLTDIKHLVGNRKTGPVFMSNRGGAYSTRAINKIVAQVGAAAGVNHPDPTKTNITCHLLRHTFARLWKKDHTRSIESLSKILGHTSIATTEDEYGTENIEDVQENYDEAIADMYS